MTNDYPTVPRRRIGARLPAGALGLLVVGAIAAIGASAQETAGSKASGTLKLVVEFNRFEDARDDLKPRGDSVGDQVVYSDPVFDERNRKRLGRAMFLNTFQDGTNVLVAGAIRLRDGTITLAGTLLNGAQNIAVTGGTGAYAGARGTYEREQHGDRAARRGRARPLSGHDHVHALISRRPPGHHRRIPRATAQPSSAGS